MCRRRGTLLALAVFSLAVAVTVPRTAEAGPRGAAKPAAEASLGSKVWSQLESWLSILRKPTSVFNGLDCDQGILIDPNGGGSSCGMSRPGGPDEPASSVDGSPANPNK